MNQPLRGRPKNVVGFADRLTPLPRGHPRCARARTDACASAPNPAAAGFGVPRLRRRNDGTLQSFGLPAKPKVPRGTGARAPVFTNVYAYLLHSYAHLPLPVQASRAWKNAAPSPFQQPEHVPKIVSARTKIRLPAASRQPETETRDDDDPPHSKAWPALPHAMVCTGNYTGILHVCAKT